MPLLRRSAFVTAAAVAAATFATNSAQATYAGAAAEPGAMHAKSAHQADAQHTAAPHTTRPSTQAKKALPNLTAERVYVESPVDTDGDGKKDRIAIDITRSSGAGKQDVIFEHSPYVDGLNDAQNHNVDVDRLPQESFGVNGNVFKKKSPPRQKPESLLSMMQNDLLVDGYATIKGHSLGTGASDGCPTSGDMAETQGTTAVIDWLNGRAKGYNSSGQAVTADWATGKVGMTGVSYNGTLPNMAAATGVEGLKAIVPVGAIANWSDYYRSNGLVVAPGGYQGEDADVLARAVVKNPTKCASKLNALEANQGRNNGDFTSFWEQRDYRDDAAKVKAGVFVVHGHSDWNVKGQNYAKWWKALEDANVPRKIWLHAGGHSQPSRSTYSATVKRFFDYWVKGEQNGIMNEPKADIQMGDGTWRTAANWPDPATTPVTFNVGTTSNTAPGTLGANGGGPAQQFTDNGKTDKAATLAASPDAANSKRLVYRSAALTKDAVLSGAPRVTLNASVDNRKAANLTALVVDYGPSGSTNSTIVTRGWIDPQNRTSERTSEPVTPGQKYGMTFDLQPKEYTFKKGNRIGLVVISTDYEYTLRPNAGTQLSLDPANSSLTMRLKGYTGPTPTSTVSPTSTASPTSTVTPTSTQSPTPTASPSACSSAVKQESGSLAAAGRAATHPKEGKFAVSASGAMPVCLDGPDGADFDLYVDRWDGARWRVVGSGAGATADEKTTVQATPGEYRIRVVSYSGSGAYSLGWTPPAG